MKSVLWNYLSIRLLASAISGLNSIVVALCGFERWVYHIVCLAISVKVKKDNIKQTMNFIVVVPNVFLSLANLTKTTMGGFIASIFLLNAFVAESPYNTIDRIFPVQ